MFWFLQAVEQRRNRFVRQERPVGPDKTVAGTAGRNGVEDLKRSGRLPAAVAGPEGSAARTALRALEGWLSNRRMSRPSLCAFHGRKT
jgi:hypothetical protein